MGCRFCEEVKRRDPKLPVLMISGHGNLDTAVAAIRAGRDRLHREAVRGRTARPSRRPRDRDRAAAPRERDVCGSRSGSDDRAERHVGSAINNVRATLKRVRRPAAAC